MTLVCLALIALLCLREYLHGKERMELLTRIQAPTQAVALSTPISNEPQYMTEAMEDEQAMSRLGVE